MVITTQITYRIYIHSYMHVVFTAWLYRDGCECFVYETRTR